MIRPTSRVRILALVVAVLAAVTVSPAAARKRSSADDATLTSVLVHAAAMAVILEGKLDAPKSALDALEAYKKKHGKAIRKALTRVFAIRGELDEPLRAEWDRALGTSTEATRLIVAIFTFSNKHAEDAATKARFDAMLADLAAELGKAEAAGKAKG